MSDTITLPIKRRISCEEVEIVPKAEIDAVQTVQMPDSVEENATAKRRKSNKDKEKKENTRKKGLINRKIYLIND